MTYSTATFSGSCCISGNLGRISIRSADTGCAGDCGCACGKAKAPYAGVSGPITSLRGTPSTIILRERAQKSFSNWSNVHDEGPFFGTRAYAGKSAGFCDAEYGTAGKAFGEWLDRATCCWLESRRKFTPKRSPLPLRCGAGIEVCGDLEGSKRPMVGDR